MLTALRRLATRAFTRPAAPARTGLVSQLCTDAQLNSPAFRQWAADMREPHQPHRKVWEWCYIAQALHERGMLRPGMKGLGFAVGEEPLASLFASRGCEVLATDLAPDVTDPLAARWLSSGQHLGRYDLLNRRGIATADDMARVRMRHVDMNHIPPDLTGFDFVWSSCSLEHLGTLELGMRFVENAVRCLRPGGVAVHTTEFNVMSDGRTIEAGPDVLFRRRDVEQIVRRVKKLGCTVAERDYSPGDAPNDRYIALPPYPGRPHLKLDYAGYTITSMGFIMTKNG